ncbi:MAG TPA: DUF3857 and transglutaminase domain-containing protein [Thermoanaerobaculia bacterium]|nr:DUF3857 and transglutaminase domain-containing protein [Thermoanaerobaculia bacterium]
MKRTAVLATLILTLLGARVAAAADDFPPITAAERALTSVPGAPNAPAVVLFKNTELRMAGYGRFFGSASSHLKVQARVKILTEAGRSNGEIAIDHGGRVRLRNFSGRTVLPDGRILPVPANAELRRQTSEVFKTFVTTVVFPAVQVGAILDYQYEIVFPSPLLLEPWSLSEEVPVLHSEILFKLATEWKMRVWTRSPLGVKIQRHEEETSGGNEIRAWADNLPAVPRVPYGPAYADLASQILLLPTAYGNRYGSVRLMEDWLTTSDLLGQMYAAVRSRDGGVAKAAREIAGTGPPRQKAEALYRFVRDEIHGETGDAVLVAPDSSLREILANHRGSASDKALLLQAMLKAVGIESRLVWAADRNRGTVDTALPNPSWFDTVLVMLELDGKRTFLDPSSPALSFGQLRAGYEGTPALIPDVKKLEGIVLPETPFDQNLRRAEIDLALDGKGRLAGTGTLQLSGLHAAERIHWQEDEEKTRQAWKDWLQERYRDFQITDVKAVEAPDERKVTLTWSMAQREEEVLGDETTVVPSAPLGPATQPFVQTAAERKLDVIFNYPDRDEVELRLRWPAGWRVEQRPQAAAVSHPCGGLSSSVVLSEQDRTLVYRRRLDITQRRIGSREDYEDVQDLFGAAAKNDAQKLTLVRQ